MNVNGGKSIRVLIFQDLECNRWIAQCLEHNLSVQAKGLKESISAFKHALIEQVALDKHFKIEPLSMLPEAPQEYFRMYEQGVPIEDEYVQNSPVGDSREIVEEFVQGLQKESRIYGECPITSSAT